jgi:hypothetical protein
MVVPVPAPIDPDDKPRDSEYRPVSPPEYDVAMMR